MKFHQSMVQMFLKCPRQFQFRYLEKIISPPKSALTIGSCMDVAETTNFTQKVSSSTDLPLSEVLDVFDTEFSIREKETVWDEDRDKCKDKGVEMLKVFHDQAAPQILPITVQEEFNLETDGGYSLGGTMDITDSSGFIRDIKTSKAEYAEDAVSQSIQAAMYDFAYECTRGYKAKGFIFDVVTKHKVPRYQKVTGEVGKYQRSRLFESINIMNKQITAGDFQYAADGAWWCSSTWCGYWHLCKGKK